MSDDRNEFRREPHGLPEGWSWRWQDEVFRFEGGTQPAAEVFSSVRSPGYVRLVQIRDYYSNAYITYVPDSTKLRKCGVNDVMLARYGSNDDDSANSLGRVCRGIEGAYNVALVKTEPLEGVLKEFLYYLLQTRYFQAPLKGRSGRSVQAGFNREGLRSILLPTPPLPEQMAIAKVLTSLDDKIAVNTRLAERADSIVRARWEAITLRAVEMARVDALFSEVGDRVQPESVDPDTPYVGLEHVPRRIMWLNDYGIAQSVSSLKATFSRGDILFGKLRPYFHKVVVAAVEGVCSTDIIVARPKDDQLAGFALAAIASDEVVAKCTATSHGTRMPRTNWKQLAAVEIPWPGQESARQFSSEIVALQNTVAAHIAEGRTLSQLRDSLIPELMSGKIRLKDAEKQVEAVV